MQTLFDFWIAMRCLKGQWPSTCDLIVNIVLREDQPTSTFSENWTFGGSYWPIFWRLYSLVPCVHIPIYWPIRGQYSYYIIRIDQSEASIQISLPVLTNQRPVFGSVSVSRSTSKWTEFHGIEHRQIMGLKLFRRDFPVSRFYIMELYLVCTGGTACDAADFVMIRK